MNLNERVDNVLKKLKININDLSQEVQEIVALFLSLSKRSKEKRLINQGSNNLSQELKNILNQFLPFNVSSYEELNFLMAIHKELLDPRREKEEHNSINLTIDKTNIPFVRIIGKDQFIHLIKEHRVLLSITESIINSNNNPDIIEQIISMQQGRQDLGISREVTHFNSIKFIEINLTQPYKTSIIGNHKTSIKPWWIASQKDIFSYLKTNEHYAECRKCGKNPLCRKNLVSILALSHYYSKNEPLILIFFNLVNNCNLAIPDIIWGWNIYSTDSIDNGLFRFFIPKDNVTSSNHDIKCGRTYDLITASEDHNGCGTTEWLLWGKEIELKKIYFLPVINCKKIKKRRDTKERFLKASLELS